MRAFRLLFPLLCAALCIFASCAKIVTPTGGERDSEPPKILAVAPSQNSVRFSGNQIRITFDEYFTLNNPTENILVSPPLSKSPEYAVNGKTLVIKLKDTLQPATTYNFLFSNAIKDYHEGNAIGMFHYSFTTGDSIDEFTIRGSVADARTLEPVKDMFVMLYKDLADSLPLTTLPNYITKTNDRGLFAFNNVSSGQFRIFALKDGNSNLKHDLISEEIAFLDAPVESYRVSPDSVPDSLKKDIPETVLRSFVAADTSLKLFRHENPAAGVYRFPYNAPITNFTAERLSQSPDYFEVINASKDTVTWYFKDLVKDSLVFILNADRRTDTVALLPFKPKQQTGRNRSKVDNKLSVTALNKGECNAPLTLQFPYPVRPIDSFDILVCTKEKDRNDTVLKRFSIPDSLVMQIPMELEYSEKKSYTVLIRDSVFWGYNNLTNDSLKIEFVAKSQKDYGSLTMHYKIPQDGKNYIATLYKGVTELSRKTLKTSETVDYAYLAPDSYRIVVFCDENGNGRWDAGDYQTKRQPEKTYIFPNQIAIRAYWESEETFDLR